MAKLDIALLILLFASLAMGYALGLVRSLLLCVASGIAFYIYPDVAAALGDWFISLGLVPKHAQLATVLTIWIPMLIMAWLLGSLVASLLKLFFLKWLDRMLGSLFGFASSFLLLAFVAVFLDYFLQNPPFMGRSWVAESRLVPLFMALGEWLLPEELLVFLQGTTGG